MHTKKWINLVISTSLLSSGLSGVPANAQQAPNLSDITGTNVWNNTAPIFQNGGRLNPDLLNNAQRLSQQLDGASNLCCNAPPPSGPRRFARGPADPNEVCINPACEQLNSVVQETKTFLSDVNRRQAEQQSASRNRIW
jgi:hypothetical protein